MVAQPDSTLRTATKPGSQQMAGPHRCQNADPMKPIIFLDLDDVMCLRERYGSYELKMVLRKGYELPDFYEQLFSRRAVEALNTVLAEFQPLVVISSVWATYFSYDEFLDTFEKVGIKGLNLHEQWWPSNGWTPHNDRSRLASISAWLAEFHRGEPFVILDDHGSGESLEGSDLEALERVALCECKVGLGNEHIDIIRRALRQPIDLDPQMLARVIPPPKPFYGVPLLPG